MKRIYLDVCCFNRPFDDQTQDRIHIESEAVLLILKHIQKEDYILVGSEIIDLEIKMIPDSDKREKVKMISTAVSEKIIPSIEEFNRAFELENLGFSSMDSLHISCAEKAEADIMVTTDDKLIKKRDRNKNKVRLKIVNPVLFLEEIME